MTEAQHNRHLKECTPMAPCPLHRECICSALRRCESCKKTDAVFPDILVNRAAELGLSLDDYTEVEDLEKAISAADAFRQENEE